MPKLLQLSLISVGLLMPSCATIQDQQSPSIIRTIDTNQCVNTSIACFGTSVISRDDAQREDADWGTFLKYFEGASWGANDVLSGVAQIKPGQEIHPPHAHAEEEYLMITEGFGTWTVNGRVFEAKSGDMLYAAPWDVHGVKNTGDTVLTFVFWKWTSTEVTPPQDPAK